MSGYLSVRFSAGFSIESIAATTATSPNIILTKLSPDTTANPETLLTLARELQPSIPAKAVRVLRSNKSAIVDFSDPSTASRAIESLNNLSITARSLKPLSISLDSAYLEIGWFLPARAARIFFAYSFKADRALDKSGRECRGRKIKVLRQAPVLGVSRPYSVLMIGLALDITESDLSSFFNVEDISDIIIKEPRSGSTFSNEDIVEYIKSLFDGTPITEFKLTTSTQERRQRAKATFPSTEDARQVFGRLDGFRHDFLGEDAGFELNLAYESTFWIPKDIYSAVKDDIKVLELDLGKEKAARLKIMPFNISAPRQILMHINGHNRSAVVQTKTAIKQLLRGEPVISSSGETLWDPALRGAEGKRLVQEIRSSTGVYVYIDCRDHSVTLYGKNYQAAKEILMNEYSLLLNRQHEIELVGAAKTMGIRGGLRAVSKHLGEDKVVVDMERNRLFVRCSPAELEKAKAILHRPPPPRRKRGTAAAKKDEAECPICLSPCSNPRPSPCGHTYCHACLRNCILSTLVTHKFPIVCITCDVPLPLQQLLPVLTPFIETQVFTHAFETYIQQHPAEYSFCPTPDCETVYPRTRTTGSFTCPHCFLAICTSCRAPAHSPQTCEEADSEADTLRLSAWKRPAGVKACPDCGAAIEKSEGCNHVHCRCGAHVVLGVPGRVWDRW